MNRKLVLTRRIGECICIGDDVLVTVMQINYGQVRISIQAPSTVEVDRQEIRERKLRGDPIVLKEPNQIADGALAEYRSQSPAKPPPEGGAQT